MKKVIESSSWRGHSIICKNGEWFYEDTLTPLAGDHRSCGHCDKSNTKEGHDGCLGTLPGIRNACCGHGVSNTAYLQFDSGECIYGFDAIKGMDSLLDIVRLKKKNNG